MSPHSRSQNNSYPKTDSATHPERPRTKLTQTPALSSAKCVAHSSFGEWLNIGWCPLGFEEPKAIAKRSAKQKSRAPASDSSSEFQAPNSSSSTSEGFGDPTLISFQPKSPKSCPKPTSGTPGFLARNFKPRSVAVPLTETHGMTWAKLSWIGENNSRHT